MGTSRHEDLCYSRCGKFLKHPAMLRINSHDSWTFPNFAEVCDIAYFGIDPKMNIGLIPVTLLIV